MCEYYTSCASFSFLELTLIDSIPLPTAQQTPNQIPLMVYKRPIQGTHLDPTFSNC